MCSWIVMNFWLQASRVFQDICEPLYYAAYQHEMNMCLQLNPIRFVLMSYKYTPRLRPALYFKSEIPDFLL